MIDVAEYINEAKRDSELLHNILTIQKSIAALEMPNNASLKDYGKLRKDGELKVSGQMQRKHERNVILFSS